MFEVPPDVWRHRLISATFSTEASDQWNSSNDVKLGIGDVGFARDNLSDRVGSGESSTSVLKP